MNTEYADIIVDISQEKLDRTFQYAVPQQFREKTGIGTRVRVPFGKGGREITGYVIGLSEEPKVEPSRIKEILGPVEQGIAIESRLISLASWIGKNYGSTMNQALKTVLPVKEKKKKQEKRFLSLTGNKEDAMEYLEECEKKHYTARARLLKALIENSTLPVSQAEEEFKATASVIRSLADKGFLSVESQRVYRSPMKLSGEEVVKKPLTPEQRITADAVLEEWKRENPRPALIRGVTGSGKTEVYMELIEEVLARGKQVIVLIPEIALTYQTVERFGRRFGACVSFMNSRLSAGERYDQFELAREGKISIVVGPRSALFTPFPNLGLIVMDEEHESSYKSEKTPCYHAREVAVQRGIMEDARIVMGSATPSVESYEKGKSGEYQLLTLENRFEGRALPNVHIVDLKEELREGNRSIFSRLLQEKIKERLQRREQIILFLNRRGYTGFVSCRSCGHVMKCPHCDVSLTSHRNGKLICHYCGYTIPEVKTCPSCNSPYIGGFKAGTQQIEELVHRLYPEARVLRMDADTTRKKDDHEKILAAFAAREADVLVGTQMIIKGHDFPEVTLVGVLAADLSLNGEDFRSGEHTFQILAQAAGRAGRGVKPGEAVIQTYQPEHYSITASASQDYEAFYNEEISYRMLMGYPPAKAMLALRGACKDEELLNQALSYCKKYIEKICPGKGLTLIGPAPQSVSKVQDMYRMVLYMRHTNREILVKIKDCLERYISINKGFEQMLMQFDFNL